MTPSRNADTLALRAINDFVAKDSRVEAVMARGWQDGLMIVRKKNSSGRDMAP